MEIGRIIETVLSPDGLVRKAKVALGDKRLNKKGERMHKCHSRKASSEVGLVVGSGVNVSP